MQEPTESKISWEGRTSVELKSPADHVWPLLADFCNLHKYFPRLSTSYQVGGVLDQPGLIRYCQTPPTDPADETSIKWVKEKLLVIDPIKRHLSYEIIENNMGFHSYVGTMQVVPINAIHRDGFCGCRIEWWVVCDPVDGWTYQDLMNFLESSLPLAAKTMDTTYSF